MRWSLRYSFAGWLVRCTPPELIHAGLILSMLLVAGAKFQELRYPRDYRPAQLITDEQRELLPETTETRPPGLSVFPGQRLNWDGKFIIWNKGGICYLMPYSPEHLSGCATVTVVTMSP